MFGSRKGASGAGTLLMIVAFLGIGGFMYWLNQTAVSAASAGTQSGHRIIGPSGTGLPCASMVMVVTP